MIRAISDLIGLTGVRAATILYIDGMPNVVSAATRSWCTEALDNHGTVCFAYFDHPCEAVRCCNPEAPKPLIRLLEVEFLHHR